MLPPGAIIKLKIHQNAYAAGASIRTPLGEITEQGRENGEEKKGKRIAFSQFFFYNLTTAYIHRGGGSNRSRGLSPLWPPHFNHYRFAPSRMQTCCLFYVLICVFLCVIATFCSLLMILQNM